MFKAPCQDPDFLDSIIFSTNSKKYLPDMINEQLPRIENLSGLEEISFKPLYESPNKVVELISSCYFKAKSWGWVIKEKEIMENLKAKNRFDYNQIQSINEKGLIREAVFSTRVLPYTRVSGWVFVSDFRIYFQPLTQVGRSLVKIIANRSVKSILKRKWILKSVGIELFTDEKSYFFAFASEKIRDEIFSVISSCVNVVSENETKLEDMTIKWQQRQLSNYSYLMYLNSIANRTFCDFSQYPVFPWVLSNYTSAEIDLKDPANYRDLSKPMGAQTPERLQGLKSRLKDIPDPKFLYGSHYSNPSIIIRWLLREHPLFSLKFQGGKFDTPDRIFHDIALDYYSCTHLASDFKELIPEFYGYNPKFLLNSKKLELGIRSNGEKIGKVKLPNWASSPEEFLRIMRDALESDYVSENLHIWIDLIFGYKQRGEQAIAADNCKIYAVFHHYTYEGAVDLESIADLEIKKTLETQIQEYGQTPKQLFKVPHAPRSYIPSIPTHNSSTSIWPSDLLLQKSSSLISELLIHSKRITSLHKLESTLISSSLDGLISINSKKFNLHQPIYCTSLSQSSILYCCINDSILPFNISTGKTLNEFKAHNERISAIRCPSQDIIISGSWDKTLKLWDVRATAKAVYQTEAISEISCITYDTQNPYIVISGDMIGNIVASDFRIGKLFEIQCDGYIFAMESTNEGLVVCGTNCVEVYKEGSVKYSVPVGGAEALATDGKFLLLGKDNEALQFWKVDCGRVLFYWEEICNVSSVFCDGSEIVAGSIEGIIYRVKD